MSEASFDLIVIGGGPAGYVASIRAAQLGMNVACIDKRETLGGTCLNVGCIPSKALLNASEKYSDAASGKLGDLGVQLGAVKLDLKAMMASKGKIVSGLTGGIDHLFKKNKVTRLTGSALLKGDGIVEVASGKKKNSYKAEKILIATGSEPTSLPNVEIDEKQIVSSKGALELTKVPKSLVVIGAGYIGLEMGTVWSRLGSKVEVVEYLPRILPGMDLDVANKFKAMMTKQGLSFHLGTAVKSAKATKSGVELTIADAKTNEEKTLKCGVALVAVGRRPNIDGLGLEALGAELTERGQIKVDEDFETNIEGVFAVGDVIPGPMLAHKAEEDGVAAVEIMAGQSGHVDYDLVPGIVYTAPEIATIGASEEVLKEKNIVGQTDADQLSTVLASYNLGPTNINKIASQINSDVQTVSWTEIREKLKVIKGSELDLVDRESYSRGQQAIDYVDRVKSYYQLLSAHSCIAPKDQLIFF